MAIIYPYRIVKQDLSVSDLVLKTDTDECFEIHEIGVTGGGTNTLTEVYIDKKFIFNFPTEANKECVAPVLHVDANPNTLFKSCIARNNKIPKIQLLPDEKLTITNGKKAGIAYVFYTHKDKAQAPPPTAPGTKGGTTRLFISHGKGETSIAAGATVQFKVNTPLNHFTEHRFPFVGGVKAKLKETLLGFCTNLDAGSGANISYLGFRIWREDETFFAPEGAFIDPGLFKYNTNNTYNNIHFVPYDIEFTEDMELSIEVECKNAGTAAETAIVNFTFFFLEEAV
jgi:hypothetical protein